MKLDDNEIRKTLIKDYIKKNWQNFAMAVFIISFLTTIILYMSSAGLDKFYFGTIVGTNSPHGNLILEVKLDNGKIIQAKSVDINQTKTKRVKLQFIQNEMLGIKEYIVKEYIQ